MECGICLEVMAVPSYRAASADETEELDHRHSRFVCGHAFHAACAVQALLNGLPRCPSCRANLNPLAAHAADAVEDGDEDDTPILFRSGVDADFNMSYHPIMRRVRSRYSDVQSSRRMLRERVHSYNRLQDRMRHLRRAAIQEALGAFRRRHYEACSAAIHGVQAALQDVLDGESKAWEREAGAPPAGAEWALYSQQTAPDLVAEANRRSENLLDRRFWSLR